MSSDKLTEVAGRQSAGAPGLLQTLRGDLDWIVMKAIEKDRTRRYESADALAGDIRRYLKHEPVLARPPSPAYSLRKLVRRNRLAFRAGAVIVTTIVMALAVSSRLYLDLQMERGRRALDKVKDIGNGPMSKAIPVLPGEIFRRTTVTGEGWKRYSASFTPKRSGTYALGFNLIAGGPSGDNAMLLDAVQVTTGSTVFFSDGFEILGLPMNKGISADHGATTFGNWIFNNFAGILAGNAPNWGFDQQRPGSADGTSQFGYLQAVRGTLGKNQAVNPLELVAGQTCTVSFYQATRGIVGGEVTYTVTLTELASDTTAPVITKLTASPLTLLPPDGRMVRVALSASTDDAVGAVTSLKIISATSNEPDSGLGDGDQAGDIQMIDNLAVDLRAACSAAGRGRIYTITVEAKDASGNVSKKSCTVTVPVDQAK